MWLCSGCWHVKFASHFIFNCENFTVFKIRLDKHCLVIGYVQINPLKFCGPKIALHVMCGSVLHAGFSVTLIKRYQNKICC